ncbi:hypothetical protein DFH11DRAFT_760739 [Phellopilus nigrolimitatus]|nr:hypothetical protein DFH11DRAFT_760739 [Phellopilus nigrolimitatus]
MLWEGREGRAMQMRMRTLGATAEAWYSLRLDSPASAAPLLFIHPCDAVTVGSTFRRSEVPFSESHLHLWSSQSLYGDKASDLFCHWEIPRLHYMQINLWLPRQRVPSSVYFELAYALGFVRYEPLFAFLIGVPVLRTSRLCSKNGSGNFEEAWDKLEATRSLRMSNLRSPVFYSSSTVHVYTECLESQKLTIVSCISETCWTVSII